MPTTPPPDRSAPPRMESYEDERARYRPVVPDNDAAADKIKVTSGGGDVSITKAP